MVKILIVKANDAQRMSLLAQCVKLGYGIAEADSGARALEVLDEDTDNEIGLLISGLNMPGVDGRALLSEVRKKCPHLSFVFATSTRQDDNAVELMRLGANDFITVPIDLARLQQAIQQQLGESEQNKSDKELSKTHSKKSVTFESLVGCDSGIKEAVHVGRKMADSGLPVMICGESGVGKEMFARAIHGESNRADKPFVAVNCGAIPKNLAESTLFGHEKGAFTGAVSKAIGKFREADGGTLFLDEVAELSLSLQVKLLRALQEKEIEPVGLGVSVPVDVRIISATHRDLPDEIGEGNFREDLYYRLNVLPLELPALRARRDDIPALAEYIVQRIATSENKPVKPISPDAMRWMQNHSWPGNVRELENMLARAMLLAEGKSIEAKDCNWVMPQQQMHLEVANDQPAMAESLNLLRPDGSRKTMEELSNDIIQRTYMHAQSNVAKTAEILGVGQSTLYRKINKADVEGEEKQESSHQG